MSILFKRILYVTVVVAVLGGLIWNKVAHKANGNTPNNPQKNPSTLLHVNAMVLKPSTFQRKMEGTGTVLANEEVSLYSEIQGVIERVYFTEDSYIKKGQKLVKIVDDEWQAELKKAQSNRELLGLEEARAKNMLQKDAISQAEYDAVRYKLKVAEAESELICAKIAKTEIRAPFNGKIGFKHVSDGSFVQPQTLLAELQDISKLKVEFSIPSFYYPYIKKGQMLHCKPEGLEAELPAKIYAIDAKIEESTRSLKVRAYLLPNKNLTFVSPGSFVIFSMPISKPAQSIMLPTHAVIPDLNTYKVFILKNGVAKEVFITIAERTEKEVEISSGVTAGDTLLTTGLLQLRNGMPVKINMTNL